MRQDDRFTTFINIDLLHSRNGEDIVSFIWHFALDLLNIYCPLTGSKLLDWGIDR